MNTLEQRKQVAYFMRRLYRHKLTTTSGGNISMLLENGVVALTPSQLDKGLIQAGQIGLMRLDGENLTPHLPPTSEAQMHLKIYEACPHVKAIVHAHPPTASAFAASASPIRIDLLSESYAQLSKVVVAPYALTGTPQLADYVAQAATQAPCILMENHGVTTLGTTLLQAFDRLELIEAAAQMTLIARQLEGVRPLDPARLRELDRLMGRGES